MRPRRLVQAVRPGFLRARRDQPMPCSARAMAYSRVARHCDRAKRLLTLRNLARRMQRGMFDTARRLLCQESHTTMFFRFNPVRLCPTSTVQRTAHRCPACVTTAQPRTPRGMIRVSEAECRKVMSQVQNVSDADDRRLPIFAESVGGGNLIVARCVPTASATLSRAR